ncbi:hypothetical protein OUZ56_009368 [Daphnia magna]|uniref:Uncharacterized protein n=1 Tax=Daphnia magna TaxID=35525 RepID=A0ABR0AFS3_9CRUS|nr:hypothetical protein OUZ56_009368 [Daphnia magna]
MMEPSEKSCHVSIRDQSADVLLWQPFRDREMSSPFGAEQPTNFDRQIEAFGRRVHRNAY